METAAVAAHHSSLVQPEEVVSWVDVLEDPAEPLLPLWVGWPQCFARGKVGVWWTEVQVASMMHPPPPHTHTCTPAFG